MSKRIPIEPAEPEPSEAVPIAQTETEAQVNARALLANLPAIESPLLLTQDELVCVRLLREACEDILKGGDISPAPEGTHKLRLIRRVSVGFFTASTPRPITP